MKKALLFAAVLFSITMQAQITKGRTLLGGTLAYSHSKGTYTGGNFFFNPAAGKVVKENLVAGIEASFSSGTLKYGSQTIPSKNKNHTYGGSIFVRKYVPLLKNFYFFAQGAAGGNKLESSETYNHQPYNETQGWNASVNLTPGLTYALTKRLYVESGLAGFGLLTYGRSRTKATDLNTGVVTVSKGSNFNFSTSLGSSIGLNIGFRLLL